MKKLIVKLIMATIIFIALIYKLVNTNDTESTVENTSKPELTYSVVQSTPNSIVQVSVTNQYTERYENKNVVVNTYVDENIIEKKTAEAAKAAKSIKAKDTKEWF